MVYSMPRWQRHRRIAVQPGELGERKGPADIYSFPKPAWLPHGVTRPLSSSRHVLHHAAERGEKAKCLTVLEIRSGNSHPGPIAKGTHSSARNSADASHSQSSIRSRRSRLVWYSRKGPSYCTSWVSEVSSYSSPASGRGSQKLVGVLVYCLRVGHRIST